jgi:hypothetical protein
MQGQSGHMVGELERSADPPCSYLMPRSVARFVQASDRDGGALL